MFLSPRNSRVSAVTPGELVPQGLNLPDNRDEQTRREHAATGAAPSLDSTPVSASVGGRARTHMFVQHQLGDVFIPHFCSIVCPPFVPLKCSNCVSQMWLPWRCALVAGVGTKSSARSRTGRKIKKSRKKQRLEEREKPSPTHSAVGIYAEALHPAFALRSLAM